MAINKRLLVKPPSTGITPSEHFGVVLYEGDGESSHSINGGKFGAAGFFENAGVIQIPNNITNTNEHSFSVWFNVNDASGNQTLLEIDTGNRIIFRIASTDANKANFGNGGWFNHGLSFSANQWYHLAITFKSGSPAKIYVDGSLQYTTGNISKASYGSNNYLGAANGSGSGSVQGKIDQFRVFQKELSSSEVSTLYAETVDTVTSLDPLSEDTTDTLQVLGDTSCIAAYQFENDETDLSGNYNGTGTEIQYAAGRYGQAASFNGSSSQVEIGSVQSSNMSVSLWLYSNVNAPTDKIVIEFSNGYGLNFNTFGGGKIAAQYANSNSSHILSDSTISSGRWYHIVGVFNSSSASLYINGINQAGGTVSDYLTSDQNTIGSRRTGQFFNGKIDQVRIFNKELSASEVTTLYEENSLVASYRFEGNANDDMRTYDGSPSNVTYEYGLNFTPDLVWAKPRTVAEHHYLLDSTRGPGYRIHSNLTAAQSGPDTNRFTSFDSGGFTVGSDNALNQSGQDFVAWCFKANGGTTSSNTDGTNTSTVQVNSDAGFSIVQGTSSGGYPTVNSFGHGLGVTPAMIIIKQTNGIAGWPVWHQSFSNTAQDYLSLNLTNAKATSSEVWGNSAPTSSVFSITDGWTLNVGGTFIAYCFAEVEGFSSFGSYVGNGSANGPIVETGFEPAFIMIKEVDQANHWNIYDNKRTTANPRDIQLQANLSDAESTNASIQVDFLSNGFQCKGSGGGLNRNNSTFLYMAFAADPDTEAPTVAKSFSTVTYTGTGAAQSITGLGFKPSLLWLKNTDTAENHFLVDSVRGASELLFPNVTNPETTATGGGVASFDSDGFSLQAPPPNYGINLSNLPLVAWAWKADDNEPTIEGGAARAVYKFEDNANDVTGNYNGTAYNVSYSSSGKFNKAADFSTGGANIAIGSPIPNTDTAVSVSAWIYLNTNATSYETVIGAGSATASSEAPFRVNVRYVSANTYKIEGLRQIAGTYYNTALSNYTDSSMPVETWHHVVWTYHPTGRTLTTYLNGSKVDTLSMGSTGSSVNDSTSVIGNFRNDTTADNFSGLIDQVRIYSGKLEDEQVSQLYAETSSDNGDLTLGGPPETIISANANAGFSIVKYTGTGVTGTRIPHGLSSAPELWIGKQLTGSSINWQVLYSGFSEGDYLTLNTTAAKANSANVTFDPTATTVKFHANQALNASGEEYIGYAFHSVSGFSKIGTYTGNGGSNSITGLGFQPDWVLIKETTAAESWRIFDSVRGATERLFPDTSGAESTATDSLTSFDSDGFSLGSSAGVNQSGQTYIYMAFKIN